MNYERTSSGLLLPKSTSATVAKIGTLSIWAHNGIVCMSHELPDGKEDFKQISVEQAIERCRAIEDDMNDLKRRGMKYETIRQHARFLTIMNDVIRRAQDQGMPTDASATRDKIRRRKTQALIVEPLTRKNLNDD